MNYEKWVRRAEQFVLGLPEFAGLAPLAEDSEVMEIEVEIAPPVWKKAVRELEEEMDFQFPERLKRFLTEGSGNCYFHYYWPEPEREKSKIPSVLLGGAHGSARLCDVEEMPELQELFHWAANDCDWVSENKKESRIWMNAIPIVNLENGEYLALDLTKDKDDPPVIYLGDTDGHKIISANFDEFLRHWEGICYLGPRLSVIDEFFDRKKRLNANSKKAAKVREFFGVTDWENC